MTRKGNDVVGLPQSSPTRCSEWCVLGSSIGQGSVAACQKGQGADPLKQNTHSVSAEQNERNMHHSAAQKIQKLKLRTSRVIRRSHQPQQNHLNTRPVASFDSQVDRRTGQQPVHKVAVQRRSNASLGPELEDAISALNSPTSHEYSSVNRHGRPAVALMSVVDTFEHQQHGPDAEQTQIHEQQSVLHSASIISHDASRLVQDGPDRGLQHDGQIAPLPSSPGPPSTDDQHAQPGTCKNSKFSSDRTDQLEQHTVDSSVRASQCVISVRDDGVQTEDINLAQETASSGSASKTSLSHAGPDASRVIRVAAPKLDGSHMAALIARFRNAPPRRPSRPTSNMCTSPKPCIPDAGPPGFPAHALGRSGQQRQGEIATLQAAVGMRREPPRCRRAAMCEISAVSASLVGTPVDASKLEPLHTCQQHHRVSHNATTCSQEDFQQQGVCSSIHGQPHAVCTGHGLPLGLVRLASPCSTAAETSCRCSDNGPPALVESASGPFHLLAEAAHLPAHCEHNANMPTRRLPDTCACNKTQRRPAAGDMRSQCTLQSRFGEHPSHVCPALRGIKGDMTAPGVLKGTAQLQHDSMSASCSEAQGERALKVPGNLLGPMGWSSSQLTGTTGNAQPNNGLEGPVQDGADPVQALLARCRRLLREGETARSESTAFITGTASLRNPTSRASAEQLVTTPGMSESVSSMWRQRLLSLLGPTPNGPTDETVNASNPPERWDAAPTMLSLPTVALAGAASDRNGKCWMDGLLSESMKSEQGMLANARKGMNRRSGSALPEDGDDLLSRWRGSRPHSAGSNPTAVGSLRGDISHGRREGCANTSAHSNAEQRAVVLSAMKEVDFERPRPEPPAEEDPLAAFRRRLAAINGHQRFSQDGDALVSALLDTRTASLPRLCDEVDGTGGIKYGSVRVKTPDQSSRLVAPDSDHHRHGCPPQEFKLRTDAVHESTKSIGPLHSLTTEAPALASVLPASANESNARFSEKLLLEKPASEAQERRGDVVAFARRDADVTGTPGNKNVDAPVATLGHVQMAAEVCLATHSEREELKRTKGPAHGILQAGCKVAENRRVDLPDTVVDEDSAPAPESCKPVPGSAAVPSDLINDPESLQFASERQVPAAASAVSSHCHSKSDASMYSHSGPTLSKGDPSPLMEESRQDGGCSNGYVSPGRQHADLDSEVSPFRHPGGGAPGTKQDDLGVVLAPNSQQHVHAAAHAESVSGCTCADSLWDCKRHCSPGSGSDTDTCGSPYSKDHSSECSEVEGSGDHAAGPSDNSSMATGVAAESTSGSPICAMNSGNSACSASDASDPSSTGARADVQAEGIAEGEAECVADEEGECAIIDISELRSKGSLPGARHADDETEPRTQCQSGTCEASSLHRSNGVLVSQLEREEQEQISCTSSHLGGSLASSAEETLPLGRSGPSGETLDCQEDDVSVMPSATGQALDGVDALAASRSWSKTPHTSTGLPPRSPTPHNPALCQERSRESSRSNAGNSVKGSAVTEVFEHYFADLFGSPDRSRAMSMVGERPSSPVEASVRSEDTQSASQGEAHSALDSKDVLAAASSAMHGSCGGGLPDDRWDRRDLQMVAPMPMPADKINTAAVNTGSSGDAAVTVAATDPVPQPDPPAGAEGTARPRGHACTSHNAPQPVAAAEAGYSPEQQCDAQARWDMPQSLDADSNDTSELKSDVQAWSLEAGVRDGLPRPQCHTHAWQDANEQAALPEKHACFPVVGTVHAANPTCPSPVPSSRTRYHNDSSTSSSPDSIDCNSSSAVICDVLEPEAPFLIDQGVGSAVRTVQDGHTRSILPFSCGTLDRESGPHSEPCLARAAQLGAHDCGSQPLEASANCTTSRTSPVKSRDGVDLNQRVGSAGCDHTDACDASVRSSGGRTHSTQAEEMERTDLRGNVACSGALRGEWTSQVADVSGDCPWDEPTCDSMHMDGIVVVSNADSIGPVSAESRTCWGHGSQEACDGGALLGDTCDARRHGPTPATGMAVNKQTLAGARSDAGSVSEKVVGGVSCGMSSGGQTDDGDSGDENSFRVLNRQGSWQSVLAVAADGDIGPREQPKLVPQTQGSLHDACVVRTPAESQRLGLDACSQDKQHTLGCSDAAGVMQERSACQAAGPPEEEHTSGKGAENGTSKANCTEDVGFEMQVAVPGLGTEVTASLDKWLFSASGVSASCALGERGMMDMQLQGLLLEEAEVLSTVLSHAKAQSRSSFPEDKVAMENPTDGQGT